MFRPICVLWCSPQGLPQTLGVGAYGPRIGDVVLMPMAVGLVRLVRMDVVHVRAVLVKLPSWGPAQRLEIGAGGIRADLRVAHLLAFDLTNVAEPKGPVKHGPTILALYLVGLWSVGPMGD